jgi:membrane protein required for colicin V production
MNGFDAVVYIALAVAMVTGFNTGLLRSAITILAYLVAMPLAIWLVPLLPPQLDGKLALPFAQICHCSSELFWSPAWSSESWRA